jgi:hypothetical protein
MYIYDWPGLVLWGLAMAVLGMSYQENDGHSPKVQGQSNPPKATPESEQKPGRRANTRSDRVRRFSKLPPATQDKVLAYGENLLNYLEE